MGGRALTCAGNADPPVIGILPVNAAIDLPSPCVSVCEIDPASGYCRGCLRSAEEIAVWHDLDFDGRLDLLERLRGRRREMGLPVRKRTRRRGAVPPQVV